MSEAPDRMGRIGSVKLAEATTVNVVCTRLQAYLAAHHRDLFQDKAGAARDYLVAYYDEEQAHRLVHEPRAREGEFPAPHLAFFAKKDRALKIVRENPYSAFSWRYSGNPTLTSL